MSRISKKIHCNKIIFCTPEKLQKEINKRFDKHVTAEEILARYPVNYRKDPEDQRDYIFNATMSDVLTEAGNIPSKVDHSNLMSPIKDQGQLGSCVSFAVTAMKEWQEQKEQLDEVASGKKYKRKSKVYDLSESWVYWKCKEIDPWPNEEGTSIRYAMKVLKTIGVPTEKAWPYNDIDYGKPKKWAKLVARWSIIDSYWRIENLNDLKTALVSGPVPIAVPVFYEFFFPNDNGSINMPASPNTIYGGHAICAVGFNEKSKFIKFKNSWGTSWGRDGYGYLPYDYVDKYLWDAWACKDLSVTREMLKGK